MICLNVFKIIALIKHCKFVQWKGLSVEEIDVSGGRQQCQGSQNWKDNPSSPPAGVHIPNPLCRVVRIIYLGCFACASTL